MELLIDHCTDSRLKRERMKEKLRKHWKLGQITLERESPDQRWRMCEARFALGDFGDFGGWEFRDPWAVNLWYGKPYDLPMWDGRSPGKVYVVGEQGLGDELFFNACLPDDCVVEVDERLIPALRRAGRECVAARFEVHTKALPDQPETVQKVRKKQPVPDGCKWWAGGGDLLRWRRPVVPYLKADPAQVERFSAYRGRVGISWRGSKADYLLDDFRRVCESPLSLQYDQEWHEGIEAPADLDMRNDVEGLMGLLANLSEVVTVSTTVGHLAVAMGVKTTVVLAPTKPGYLKFPWKWHLYGVPVFKSLREYLKARKRVAA